jgi:hypothetical protein
MLLELVPAGTRITAKGEGQAFDVGGSPTRTFLCVMHITEVIEQESLDVAIWGSPDGQNWGQKPILKLPQRFYRGETRMVLDLSVRPEVKFIQARWEVNRWGRVAPTPMFVFGLQLTEVAASTRPAPKIPAAASS